MKKLFVLFFISIFSFTGLEIQAQDYEGLAREAALEICDCIEPMLKDLHPALIEYMVAVVESGEEEGQATLMDYLINNPDEQEAIMADAAKLEGIDNNGQMTNCFNKIEENLSDLEVNENVSREEFEGAMYDAIGAEPKCRLTNLLLIIGEKSN